MNVSISEMSVGMPFDMGDISPSQGWGRGIFRESRWARLPCDISRMPASPNIQAIRETIDREMKRKGFSGRGLSKAAGVSESTVKDVLKSTENPGIGTLYKIAEALEVPFESISGADGVPLLGTIGAGGSVAYFRDDHEFETVPRPPLAPARLMALQVSGDSMLPKYEPGDIIYVQRDHDGVCADYLGKYCAVHTADGGTYLKILAAGTEPERYILRSLNAADMTNVEVVWAAPVLFVMPKH